MSAQKLTNGLVVTVRDNGMLWVTGKNWSTAYVVEESGHIRPALATEAIAEKPESAK